MIRFVLEFSYVGLMPDCLTGEPDPTPSVIADVHYLHFGIILFVIVFVVTVVVSLATPPPDAEAVINTTFATRFDFPERSSSKSGVSSASSASIAATTPASTPVYQSTVSLAADKEVYIMLPGGEH